MSNELPKSNHFAPPDSLDCHRGNQVSCFLSIAEGGINFQILRKLCGKCKRPVEPRPEEYAEFNALRGRFYAGKGCDECNRLGYKGRTAVYEILPVTNGLLDLISKNAGPAVIREHLESQGFVTLRAAALEKAERGETSVEEVLRETA